MTYSSISKSNQLVPNHIRHTSSITFDSPHPLANLLKVATNTNLSVEARLLYVILVLMAWSKGRCWPSQSYQAQALGRSDRSIRTYQQELEQAGVMIVERIPGRSNRYHPAILSRPRSKNQESDDRPTPETDCRLTLKSELQNVENVVPFHQQPTCTQAPFPVPKTEQNNVNAFNIFPKFDESEPPQDLFLVEEIERVTRDTWSRGHFVNLVRQVNEQTIWSALSVTCEKMTLESGVNGGAFFTATVRRMAGIQNHSSHQASPVTSEALEVSRQPPAQSLGVSHTEPEPEGEIDVTGLIKGWKILYQPGRLESVFSQVCRCLPGWDVAGVWEHLNQERAGDPEEGILDEFLELAAMKVRFQSTRSSEIAM
jgi:hypothetical protein